MPHNIAPEIVDLAHPIDDLSPYEGNARTHNMGVIRDSLRENGQYRAIVVNHGSRTGRKNEILAGNGTWEGAKAEGWDVVAVTWVDVDDHRARKIVAVDNRANDVAGYDDRLLAELLAGLDDDLAGSGFDEDDVAKLIAGIAEGEGDNVPDFQPDDDQPSLDSVRSKTCPSCGFEWREGAGGEVVPV